MKFAEHSLAWITAGLCALLLLPALFMDGMFMDGVLYASVSRNYAEGYGTFWFPYFSEIFYRDFHEQPPLMFFLQGTFMKVLGTGMYTERIYSLIAALISIFLVHRCWTIVRGNGKTGWLPVLAWFIMPVTFWAYTNNVEECTMTLFVLAAMIHLLRAMHEHKRETLHLLLAGLWILLAGLTKGLQGMFLLAGPFVWWLTVRNTSFVRMVWHSVLVAAIPALFAVYAWFTPDVHASFDAYFTSRFSKTFSGITATTASRFHLLFELLLDTLPLLVVGTVLLLSFRKSRRFSAGWESSKKLVLFFLLVALTGILPLLVTLEQRGFYLVTALPYVALAFTLLVAPQAELLETRALQRRKLSAGLGVFGLVLLAGAVAATFFMAGKPRRDEANLHDLPLIAAQTGERTTLVASNVICSDWPFLCYAMRYHGLSFNNQSLPGYKWLLLEKADPEPVGYAKVDLRLTRFGLYEKR